MANKALWEVLDGIKIKYDDFKEEDLKKISYEGEVEIDGKFPEPEYAEYPMNVISIYDTTTHTIYAWTYKSDVYTQLTDERIDEIQATLDKSASRNK